MDASEGLAVVTSNCPVKREQVEVVLWFQGNPRDAKRGGNQVPRKQGCLLQQEGAKHEQGPETGGPGLAVNPGGESASF